MALKTNIENLVIGFDTKKQLVKILRCKGADFKNITVEELQCDENLMNGARIFDVLDKVLSFYLATEKLSFPDTFIVLPDYLVSTDIITLPTLAAGKQKDVLGAFLARMYPNFQGIIHKSMVVGKNKRQTTFAVSMADKNIVAECAMVCKKHDLNLRVLTFAANAMVNSFLALATRSRPADFLLVDIKETQTKVAYVLHDKTTCFFELPFGQNLLLCQTPAHLADFVESPAALREIFNVSGTTLSEDITFAGATIEEIEAMAFQHFCTANSQRLRQAESALVQTDAAKPVVEQNFDVFARYLSGFLHSVVNKYALAAPQCAFVNVPDGVHLEKMAKDFDIELVSMKNSLAEKCLITDYFDLFGAVYASKFNAAQNFMDRDKAFSGLGVAFKGAFAKKDKKQKPKGKKS